MQETLVHVFLSAKDMTLEALVALLDAQDETETGVGLNPIDDLPLAYDHYLNRVWLRDRLDHLFDLFPTSDVAPRPFMDPYPFDEPPVYLDTSWQLPMLLGQPLQPTLDLLPLPDVAPHEFVDNLRSRADLDTNPTFAGHVHLWSELCSPRRVWTRHRAASSR